MKVLMGRYAADYVAPKLTGKTIVEGLAAPPTALLRRWRNISIGLKVARRRGLRNCGSLIPPIRSYLSQIVTAAAGL